ncbi:MAG: glycosyltransferase [Fibrobacter sp.]|nr:glycosyltransferase [Fibrobacter sp.]
MNNSSFDIVILGLTITSSWGNGHATTYRGLIKELLLRGHQVLFLEREMPWYASKRDLLSSQYGCVELYYSFEDLKQRFTKQIADAEYVIVGSYVPEGIKVGEWVLQTAHGVKAFYDIDTPVTMAKLLRRECEYISSRFIPQYDLYLSFAGGPILELLEQTFGASLARPLYCSVDPEYYYPQVQDLKYDLGYMGTYSEDRHPTVDRMILKSAARWSSGAFVIAGPQFPDTKNWPSNVSYIDHISPSGHREFYCSQKFTLNITRADMIQSGYAPSVRLFEAAACGTAIISDYWEGLSSLFTFGDEILLSATTEHTLRYLREIPDSERIRIGERARKRIFARHTAAHRAQELEIYLKEAKKKKREYTITG